MLDAGALSFPGKQKINTARVGEPAFRMVLTAVGEKAFQMQDGTLVVPIGCLKP